MKKDEFFMSLNGDQQQPYFESFATFRENIQNIILRLKDTEFKNYKIYVEGVVAELTLLSDNIFKLSEFYISLNDEQKDCYFKSYQSGIAFLKEILKDLYKSRDKPFDEYHKEVTLRIRGFLYW